MNGTTTGPKWAIYCRKRFWLVDTCAEGTWSSTAEEATWFNSEDEASRELDESDVEFDPHDIVFCRVR
jgi:hypothetical protein